MAETLEVAWLCGRDVGPLARRLAAEGTGRRCPELHRPRLHRSFQPVAMLRARVLQLLVVILGALIVAVPPVTRVPMWAGATIVVIAAGVCAVGSGLRLRDG